MLKEDKKYSERVGSLVVSVEHSSLLPHHILKYHKRAMDYLANFCANYRFKHNAVDGIPTVRYPTYEGTRCMIRKIKRVKGLNDDLPYASAYFQIVINDSVLASSFLSMSSSYKKLSPFKKKMIKTQKLIEQKVLEKSKTFNAITNTTILSNGNELCLTVLFHKATRKSKYPTVTIIDESKLWAQLLEYKETLEHNQVKQKSGKIDRYKNIKFVWVDTPKHYLKRFYNNVIIDTRVEWVRKYKSSAKYSNGYPR